MTQNSADLTGSVIPPPSPVPVEPSWQPGRVRRRGRRPGYTPVRVAWWGARARPDGSGVGALRRPAARPAGGADDQPVARGTRGAGDVGRAHRADRPPGRRGLGRSAPGPTAARGADLRRATAADPRRRADRYRTRRLRAGRRSRRRRRAAVSAPAGRRAGRTGPGGGAGATRGGPRVLAGRAARGGPVPVARPVRSDPVYPAVP